MMEIVNAPKKMLGPAVLGLAVLKKISRKNAKAYTNI